ncbi:hypothetical protein LUZ61_017581 [Rhynchospora tenuis]|uniref:Amino acid transporter transmembrane domain-containing protein n=1 Tax=Rhynchospora tenuis TaxID=198213 RepID=A0AAD5Z7P3_9POAL|nr:hypothetical protein LUZ61_017581 [Rhynchospora tenuis]
MEDKGTVWSASAHIITAVFGSAVLSLPWAICQLGWVAGLATMLLFSFVTYYTSALLSDCYRSGDPCTGNRNYTYMDAVQANLNDMKVKICGFLQYANLVSVAIGYTIAASVSMVAIKRSNCFHKHEKQDTCLVSSNIYMIIFGIIQIIFSQIPDFDQISWLSIVATVMSLTYSTIGLGLGIVQVVANGGIKGSFTGISIGVVTPMDKVWRSLQAFGDIAFAYSYSLILIEIQDTIKAPPPSEAKVMKRSTIISVVVTTVFYMLCGCMGYAAFGDATPENLLNGFGFYNPFWLLDIANATIVIYFVAAYQVHCQHFFAFVEKWAQQTFPESQFIKKEITIPLSSTRSYKLNLFRLTWCSIFVVLTTVISMLMPFFIDVVRFVGALGFWPMTVYFPVEMSILCKRRIEARYCYGYFYFVQDLCDFATLEARKLKSDHDLRPTEGGFCGLSMTPGFCDPLRGQRPEFQRAAGGRGKKKPASTSNSSARKPRPCEEGASQPSPQTIPATRRNPQRAARKVPEGREKTVVISSARPVLKTYERKGRNSSGDNQQTHISATRTNLQRAADSRSDTIEDPKSETSDISDTETEPMAEQQLQQRIEEEIRNRDEARRNRPLRTIAAPAATHVGLGVAPPNPGRARDIAFNPSLIALIQQNMFGGDPFEDANQHLTEFLQNCTTLNYDQVPDDTIRLTLFPFTLRNRAKAWLGGFKTTPFETWDALAKAFLDKFYPREKTVQIVRQINTFKQEYDENLSEAWEKV